MTMDNDVSLTTLDNALVTAEASYQAASDEESAARSKATAALNRLNEAQKAFDAAVERRRKAAPFASDWTREQ